MTTDNPESWPSVPPVRVVFEDEDRKRVLEGINEVLASGMVAASKKVKELEEFWAQYTGCKHAIACGSGGAALEVLMKAMDIHGKDVLVPTNTFIATVNAVIFAGGNPIFLDADPASMGVNLAEIQKKRTPNTVGLVPVHIGGIITSEMSAIADWCKEQHIWLIEDAAHAHGSELAGVRAGNFGLAAAYSFFATKVMTSGEGGMIVCNDDGFADVCRRYIDYGKRSQWETVHVHLSSNYRMSDINAVIGLEQSLRLDEFIASRSDVADRYTAGLKGVVDLVLPSDRCSWYKYIIAMPEGLDREQFRADMKERKISLAGGVYDIPVHLQPVFQDWKLAGTLPMAEDICARHASLPIWYGMKDEQVNHVISSVTQWMEAHRQ